jgi:prepilin-type N-terminal cleavage/methylation domain-containing protein
MKKGFSLVELLVVISIIAVITAVLLPNFMGAREKARDSQRIQDLSAMKVALRMYYNENQAYPTPVGTAGALGSPLGAGFATFMPAIQNLGYTYGYAATNGNDGFIACILLENRGGPDAVLSQGKCNVLAQPFGVCGQGVGVTGPGVFTVCAN